MLLLINQNEYVAISWSLNCIVKQINRKIYTTLNLWWKLRKLFWTLFWGFLLQRPSGFIFQMENKKYIIWRFLLFRLYVFAAFSLNWSAASLVTLKKINHETFRLVFLVFFLFRQQVMFHPVKILHI